MSGNPRAVVIGVGNEFRRDDGAAIEVIRRLGGAVPSGATPAGAVPGETAHATVVHAGAATAGAVPAHTRLLVSDGEPAALIDAWQGADLVIVVDAVADGTVPPKTEPPKTAPPVTVLPKAVSPKAEPPPSEPPPSHPPVTVPPKAEPPVTVHRIVLAAGRSGSTSQRPARGASLSLAAPDPAPLSWHGGGLQTAIALSRVLGCLPATLIVYGIQGVDFGWGTGLSAGVAAAAADLAVAVLTDLAESAPPPPRR